MGGYGSGQRWDKKTVVEDCLPLVASHWMRDGILKAGVNLSGRWQWKYPDGHVCSIDYEANTTDLADPYLRVMYTLPSKHETFDYRVGLTTTRPQFGGLRWWFICPLIKAGKACGRRVGKLFSPPGECYFGCRHCYDLTYTTCQQSHVDDALMLMLAARMGTDFETVKALMKQRRNG